MIPLFTQEEFNKTKSREKLPLQCKYCGETFHKTRKSIVDALNPNNHRTAEFCSISCLNKNTIVSNNGELRKEVVCKHCGDKFFKKPTHIRKTKNNNFCSSSCAAIHNNTNKKYGIRRSKIESHIEDKLRIMFPTLDINFNKKDTIGSELDIYIPSLKLAIEINGVFHYKPIYGDTTFRKIIYNDSIKVKKCHDLGIELMLVDISSLNKFTEKHSKIFVDMIISEIEKRINIIRWRP